MNDLDWRGLYRERWTGEIVPEAFAHPAKYSRGLIRHIYQHAIDEGWLHPGDTVLDPFGGVALGSLDAMRHGLHWLGVELEPKFVALGQQNIDLWLTRYAPHFPAWGTARLLRGDSRHLAAVVQGAGACVSSPPYADGCAHTGGDDQHTERMHSRYIGVGLNGAIASPPYAGSISHPSGIDMDKVQSRYGPHCQGAIHDNYGSTPGQLGALAAGDFGAVVKDFGAVVSSPPFEQQVAVQDPVFYAKKCTQTGRNPESAHAQGITSYGEAPGNLGNDAGDTFWTAARLIVEQVYQVLTPGAPAIWVVKSFVRRGERVNFPSQWEQLCVACGFAPVHQHRAWLVEDRGAQFTLDNGLDTRRVERKSFFRRLAEKKGSPRIDWETVLCMRKPTAG